MQTLIKSLEMSPSSKSKSLTMFWDRQCLPIGQDWEQGFVNVLRNCGCIIVLISPEAVERCKTSDMENDNFLLEMDLATELHAAGKTTVIPVFMVDKKNYLGGHQGLLENLKSGFSEARAKHPWSRKTIAATMRAVIKLPGAFKIFRGDDMAKLAESVASRCSQSMYYTTFFRLDIPVLYTFICLVSIYMKCIPSLVSVFFYSDIIVPLFYLDTFLVKYLSSKHQKVLRENAPMQNALEVYVPLKFSMVPPRPGQAIADTQCFSLEALMQALLTGSLQEIHACFPESSRPAKDTKVFLIQGSAGTGKSLFCWRTMQCFDKQITTGEAVGRVPIVITLPSVKDRLAHAPVDFLVQTLFDVYPALHGCFENLDPLTRQELFMGLSFLFFLDSVDELSDMDAISNVNRVYNPGQWRNSVFVITCRSEVLDSNVISNTLSPRQFLPDGPVQPALMTSVYLLPFSMVQMDTYVAKFAEKHVDLNHGWTADRYKTALTEFSELRDFIQEPLLLFIVLNVLPTLVAGKETSVSTDLCNTHQRVGHHVHILYQDNDLVTAYKLALDIEQHPDANRKGLTVFLRATCEDGISKPNISSQHLFLAHVIVPLISSSIDSSTRAFLEDVVLAIDQHKVGKLVCPLYLASSTPSDAVKTLLQTTGLSSAALKSLSVLDKLQGMILKPGKEDWSLFVHKIVKEFEIRRFYYL